MPEVSTPARALTPEALVYGLASPSDPQISPDGTRICYSLQTVQRATKRALRQLWLCGVDGGQPRPISPLDSRASGARWSPDGQLLAYTAAGPSGSTSIFVTAPDAHDSLREITRHANPIGELAWSADGQTIAYTTLFDPDNPHEHPATEGAAARVLVTRRLDYKQDGRGFLGNARSHVFVLDVPSGAHRRLTSEYVDHSAPMWSPDGQYLLVHAARASAAAVGRPNTMSLLLVDPTTGHSQAIASDEYWVEQAIWSLSGDRIVFSGETLPRTFQSDFFVYDLANGRTRRVTDDLPFALSGLPPSPLAWLDDQRVLFTGVRSGASGLEMLDLQTGQVETLWREQSKHAGLSLDRARRYVVQEYSTLTAAPEVWVYDLVESTGRTITAYNTGLLEERPGAAWERLEVNRGDFAIEGWLLKPADFDPARHYPVVLDIHGGPASNYGYAFMAHQQCFATHGFLLVFANPRGSTSYGRRFTQAVDWGQGDYGDILAVLDTVLARPYADSERVGIFGYSYGGYLCAWAIARDPHRFQAAVCGSMFFDLTSAYGTADNRGIAAHAGGTPHERPAWYAAHSPATYAHRTRTPTLLIHGEADQRITVGQTEQMFVALTNAECEVEMVRYPGASHMFIFLGLPEHRVDFLTRVVAWFKQHLGEPV